MQLMTNGLPQAAAGFVRNQPNTADCLDFLAALPADATKLMSFDPQYKGVAEKQKYGNLGERMVERFTLPQMDDATIVNAIKAAGRVIKPFGYLLVWLDTFHICEGTFKGIFPFQDVTLLTWAKLTKSGAQHFGMGYRTRGASDQLLIKQRVPYGEKPRAKGTWKRSPSIRDAWFEPSPGDLHPWAETPPGDLHPHMKPLGLQRRLIEATTEPGDLVIDPCAGAYTFLAAARAAGREFLGCDVVPWTDEWWRNPPPSEGYDFKAAHDELHRLRKATRSA